MSLEVHHTADAAEALDAVRPLLLARPVEHNVVLTILEERVRHPEPGRYWWAVDGSGPVGFVLQSPLTFRAWIGPATSEVLTAFAARIAEDAPDLPGISGDAASAALFAGHWTEQGGTGATPVEGGRLYRLRSALAPDGVTGRLRQAGPSDRDLLVGWTERFRRESGEEPVGVEAMVDHRLPRGWLWIWDDDGPVSMAMATEPVGGVTRVGLVYTPDDLRRRGYASACVAEVSAHALSTGADTCILYTQLHNATSNRIYRRIGYEPVSEVLVYRFDKYGR